MPEPYTSNSRLARGCELRIATHSSGFNENRRYHNPLHAVQLSFAGREAIVHEVG